MSKMSTTFPHIIYGPCSRTKVLTRETNWHKRKMKKAIYIRQGAPTMNRDRGYHLPAIYNQIIPPKSEATHVTPVREQGP